jgi:hypothetical protein
MFAHIMGMRYGDDPLSNILYTVSRVLIAWFNTCNCEVGIWSYMYIANLIKALGECEQATPTESEYLLGWAINRMRQLQIDPRVMASPSSTFVMDQESSYGWSWMLAGLSLVENID